MNFWEAIKSLEEGKKVRRSYWEEDSYIYIDSDNNLRDNYGGLPNLYYIPDDDDDWEIYKDRKPAPTILKTLANDLSCNSSDICMKLSFDEQLELVAVLAQLNMIYKIY